MQRILTKNFSSVEIDSDGGFRIRFGSTACFISIGTFGEDDTVVSIKAPILFGVPTTDEVYRWAATEGQAFVFGSASVFEDEDGTVVVGFHHSVLGTYLDEDELMHALLWPSPSTADRSDE